MIRHGMLCVLLLCGTRLLHAQDAPCNIAYAPDKAVYPAIAKAAHVQGDVVFLGSFDHDGSLLELKLVSGPEMLRLSSREEVRQWRATPFPGSRTCPLAVHFRLTGDDPAHSVVSSPREPGQLTVMAPLAAVMCQCAAPPPESRLHAFFSHPLYPFRRMHYAY